MWQVKLHLFGVNGEAHASQAEVTCRLYLNLASYPRKLHPEIHKFPYWRAFQLLIFSNLVLTDHS